jgi:glycosyltransferase involved in cell wall biosynthesis
VVAQNRRLAHQMAVQGAGEWEVTAVAPARLQGDLRYIELEPIVDESCSLVPIGMRFGSHPHLRTYDRRLQAILRQQWDVVHVWEEPYVLAAAQVARGVQAGVRVIPATFQNISKRYPAPIGFLERQMMRRADGWIAFGQMVKDALHDRTGYRNKPVRVLSPGVDTDAFRPDPAARARIRKRLGWSADDAVVGFSGRFIPEKGIATLLAAFAHSTRRWNALFVGGGTLTPELESLRLRHPSRIRVVRDVGHDEMPSYLRAMDVLCAPSRTTPKWREQFGRMLIEAMACGVPVIGSNSGEIPHVVADAGVVIPEDDQAQWTETIDRLVGDAALREDLARRGLDRARTQFAWPIVARRHLDFFTEVLE